MVRIKQIPNDLELSNVADDQKSLNPLKLVQFKLVRHHVEIYNYNPKLKILKYGYLKDVNVLFRFLMKSANQTKTTY